MTTPGGVPNLPMGALTLDTLAEKLHDMSPTAMRGRAAERMPSIFNSSMGGNPMSDFSFLGLMTQLFAGFNSAVANADPADVTGPDDLPGLLIDFIEELPVIGELITMIESIMNGEFDPAEMVTSVENMFETLGSMLFGADFNLDAIFAPIRALVEMFDFSSPEAFLTSLINALLALPMILLNLGAGLLGSGAGLLGSDSPLDASSLFGSIPSALMGMVPFSHIGDASPNLLTVSSFSDAVNISGGGLWSFDSLTGHTIAGSAKTTANGTNLRLMSNQITVTEGQTLDIAVWTKWSGLAFTGTPIKLQVVRFLGGAEVGTDDIAAPSSPGTDQAAWLQLSDSYTVPAGCDQVCLQFHVAGTATAGQVWFDDASAVKTGMLQREWVSGLTGFLTNLSPSGLLDLAGVPNLPADRITSGSFAQSMITGLVGDLLGKAPVTDMTAAQTDIVALDGRVTALEGGGTVTTYTVSATWTNPSPSTHTAIQVICVNGGDGGSRGDADIRDTAKGGQSGGYMQKTLYTDEISSTVAMTMGAGGSGSTSTGTRGGTGGTTSFGSYVVGVKGIGAIFKDGSYAVGIPPGDGGDGGYFETDAAIIASQNGVSGPFAPGGLAGFGDTSGELVGLAGSAAPSSIPSGGGGGGGGSVSLIGGISFVGGAGGAGGFPGGGGGGGGRGGTSYGNGAAGAAGCIYIIEGD